MNLYEITYRTAEGKIDSTYVHADFMSIAILKAIRELPAEYTVIGADFAKQVHRPEQKNTQEPQPHTNNHQ